MPRNNTQRKLENHLTLHGWLNSRFEYKTTRELLNAVRYEAEGFNPDGHSPICEFLISRTESNSLMAEALPRYDTNIKQHLSKINNRRTQPIVLRYFQYMSLLYTEIFLDWKYNRHSQFLRQLNSFVKIQNMAKDPGDAMDSEFTASDIDKLAFWMATGAGKTLIMHINYHQLLHYCQEPLDHIVLITPNEGLSEQHMRELANSDIRCDRFNVEGNRLTNASDTVQVIEITKLVEEKTSGGVSVPVEAFEGNNLIFVDEGHKGSGGKVWREYREALAKTGFTFEYSATFGQALAAAKNANLVDEYGKAIAFDYSYRYFYEDGYGKNFRILNVKHDETTQTETLLMGNLLSFYEQRLYFKEETEAVQTYGLDPPLWAFVGSRVNAVYTEKRIARSDILNVIRFLHQFLMNEKNRAINTIENILNDESGLKDDNGTDVFKNRLSLLRERNDTPTQIYRYILKEIFHTNFSGALHLCDVQNAPGEIALKTTHGSNEFGLIYIGDTSAFKKLVQNDDAAIKADPEDVITESHFNKINTDDSPINILIGAKKFIEGWDSWRVTTMGLLNIGTNEGSQIIQLFGRGVRLRGKNMSLKRSTSEDKERPDYLPLLETLNIFAVRANFMAQFRDYLMREGVPTEEPVQIELPIRLNTDHLEKRLYIPDVQPYHSAAKGQCVPLEVIPGPTVTYTTQSIEIIGSSSQSSQTGIRGGRAQAAHETTIPEKSLKLINWEKIYLQLLEYKHEKGYTNLIFNTEILKAILNPDKPTYKLTVMNESEVIPTTLMKLDRLEELVLILLRKYISKFYRLIQKRWNEERLQLEKLDKCNGNFTNWHVSIPPQEANKLKPQIEHLIESEEIYGPHLTDLPNIHNERHLYQPLLTVGEVETTLRTSPPALEESEEHFVQDLRSFVRQNRQDLLTEKNIFLLRNQSRGKGIGFYQNEGFYPDFILWILDGAKQRIVFIEPHGMIYDAINDDNEKITLFKRFHTLSHERFRGEHVKMDAFMISKTSIQDLQRKYPDISKESFAENWHILFRDPINFNYLSPIFQDSGSSNTL